MKMLDTSFTSAHPVSPHTIREAHLWLLAKASAMPPPTLTREAAQWLIERGLMEVDWAEDRPALKPTTRGKEAVLGRAS